MTKVYDYSEFDVRDFIYHFGILSPAEAQARRDELAEQKRLKAKEKEASQKPKLKPKLKLAIKPKSKPANSDSSQGNS